MTMAAKPVHWESDCAAVIHNLNTPGRSKSEAFAVLTEAKHALQSLVDFRVSKVHRTGNPAAHELAKYGSTEIDCGGVLIE